MTQQNNFINELTLYSYPKDSLISKAIFLEETLEKMQRTETYFLYQLYKIAKTDKEKQKFKESLKDIRKGIKEVFEKCNVIWDDIKKGKNDL